MIRFIQIYIDMSFSTTRGSLDPVKQSRSSAVGRSHFFEQSRLVLREAARLSRNAGACTTSL